MNNWTHDTHSPVNDVATYKEIIVYLLEETINAVVYGSNQTLWQINNDSSISISVTDDGIAYIACSSSILVVDIETGKVLNHFKLNQKDFFLFNKIAISDSGDLFVSSHASFSDQNHSVILSKYSSDFTLLWSIVYKQFFIDTPILSIDQKYVFLGLQTRFIFLFLFYFIFIYLFLFFYIFIFLFLFLSFIFIFFIF